MAIEIFDNCDFGLTLVKKLYIGSRQLNGNVIEFPIDYTTIEGTEDSVIGIDSWNDDAGTVTIGGQTIEWREITQLGENITFQEEYLEGKQGKTYVKRVSFNLPRVVFNTNASLKEFIFTADGKFAISNAVAFIVDQNDQQWIVGYDKPLILQDGMEIILGVEDNQYNLNFQSISYSRARNYQIIGS